MAVEVNDTDWSIVAVDGAQKGKSDGVVTSKSDQTREGGSLLGWAGLVCMGVGCAAQEEVVALFDLLECESVVIAGAGSIFLFTTIAINLYLRGDRNITTVHDLCPRVEWVCFQWNVVSATESNPA